MKMLRMLGLIVLSVMILAACTQEKEQPDKEARTVPVDVAEVTFGNITDVQTIYGRTSPKKTTPVLPEAPGEVDEVEVSNGDIVKEDDLLITIRTQAGTIRVTSPVDGEIAQFALESGDMVTPDEPLGLIIDTDTMDITLEVTAGERSQFSVDDTLGATIDDVTYEAVVKRMDSLPNDTGLYDIQLSVDNQDNAIIAGMIAAVEQEETRIEDALIVPTESIIEESDGAFVYVVKDDVARQVTIEIKDMRSDETAIEGELEEGDHVVVNGQLTVTDGSKVEVVKVVNES